MELNLDFDVNEKFQILYDLPAGTRLVSNIGGRGSGKSYEAARWLLTKAMFFNKRVVVLRDENSTVEESILKDIKAAFDDLDEMSNGYFSTQYVMSTNTFKKKGSNSNLIFTKGFRSSSNSKKTTLKGISNVDIAVIEEFSDITDEFKYNSLCDSIRNEDYVILINSNVPDKNHWFIQRHYTFKDTAHEGFYELVPKSIPGVVFISTTYLDNPMLNKSKAQEYEARGNPESHTYDLHYFLTEIMCYCSTGRKGQIYSGWHKISNEEYNKLPYKENYGLDFGWSASPMALIGVKTHNGRRYRRQLIYKKNMNLVELAIRMIELKLGPDDLIVADCAEPKSISKLRNGWTAEELREDKADKYPQLMNCGFNIHPCLKGPDSIKAGIDQIKTYENYITSESEDWWSEEYPMYCWDKDKNGNPTDQPIDDYNHLMDADRYEMMAKGRLW